MREAKGLTQEQLADRIGRSVDTVENIERGVAATRIEVAYQIAIELGVRLPDLFTFEPALEPVEAGRSAAVTALINHLADCADRTASLLLDMIRVALIYDFVR